MALSDRQHKILEAIINDYIQTAEPIGSRTIAKKYAMGISSATIRNEMSDLEDMGLITQPHTSSGRVPSQKGYRFYVDSMMPKKALTSEESLVLQQMILSNIYQVEHMMKKTATALARLTRYTAIVSEPYLKKTKIKHVQMIPVDDKTIFLVMVTDTKSVKNQPLSLSAAPEYEELNRLSNILTKHLSGKTIQEIDRPLIDQLLISFAHYAHILMPILGVIVGLIQDEDDMRVFTSGAKNILAFPEFSDIRKAEAIFQALEERDALISILNQPQTDNIQIIIGNENSLEILKDCSLIKANYSIDNQSTGSIALIGPTRMDYGHAVSVLQGILQNIQHVLKALSEG
ncbi:MAG: heat-inducible transcriptional repressor HrcA [Defluviitaleaceae bacterium]|nr:heat-inducible transcriptional repressor HrcA [Defluviitaleaceae bacterium]